MKYYIVAWGDNWRISDKVSSPNQACIDCYGMVSPNMTAVAVMNWKYATNKRKKEFLDKLAELHERKTGEKIIHGY